MKKVLLSKKFENQLNSRLSINSIFNGISSETMLDIDFQEIDFVSRAVAYEIITRTIELSNKGVNVKFSNLNSEVEKLLNTVKLSIKDNVKKATFIQQKSFKSETDFNAYLLSI